MSTIVVKVGLPVLRKDGTSAALLDIDSVKLYKWLTDSAGVATGKTVAELDPKKANPIKPATDPVTGEAVVVSEIPATVSDIPEHAQLLETLNSPNVMRSMLIYTDDAPVHGKINNYQALLIDKENNETFSDVASVDVPVSKLAPLIAPSINAALQL